MNSMVETPVSQDRAEQAKNAIFMFLEGKRGLEEVEQFAEIFKELRDDESVSIALDLSFLNSADLTDGIDFDETSFIGYAFIKALIRSREKIIADMFDIYNKARQSGEERIKTLSLSLDEIVEYSEEYDRLADEIEPEPETEYVEA